MSRIIIIGGSGHVGSYLVPALVTMGHEVVNVSRGISAPYRAHSAWEQVESVILDRTALRKPRESLGQRSQLYSQISW